MALSPETDSYNAYVYDTGSASFAEWMPAHELGIHARVVPVSYFGEDGNLQRQEVMHMAPALVPSPDRSRILWLTAHEKWAYADFNNQAYGTVGRPDVRLGAGTPLWYADNLRWTEPRISSSGQTYSHVDVYSVNGGTESRRTRGIQTGVVAGTTVGNEQVVLIQDPDSADEQLEGPGSCTIMRADIELGRANRRRHLCAMPKLLRWAEVALSPDGESLAWILVQKDAPDKPASLWQSAVNGRNMATLGLIDHSNYPQTRVSTPSEFPRPYDLEWEPDGSGLSFIVSNIIYRVRTTDG